MELRISSLWVDYTAMMHPLEFSVSRWKDGSIIIAFNKGNWREHSATLMSLPSPQCPLRTSISHVFLKVYFSWRKKTSNLLLTKASFGHLSLLLPRSFSQQFSASLLCLPYDLLMFLPTTWSALKPRIRNECFHAFGSMSVLIYH